ncbi:MAG: rRNA maturation RNase YbeY [Cyanobacteriota bacterium]|jgi:probable rRNA maturation factor
MTAPDPSPSGGSQAAADLPEVDLAFNLEAGLAPAEASLAGATDWISATGSEANWRGVMRRWLGALAGELPPPLSAPAYCLGLSLVGDATIAALNATWRRRQGATDVLAFAAQEEAPPLPPFPADDSLELGDIIISLDTAARQAAEAGQPLERELLFLASHGLLHLLGWDHPDDASLAAMVARQEELLAAIAQGPVVAADPCARETTG